MGKNRCAGGAFILAIVLYVAAGHKPDGKQTTAAVDPAPESVAVVNPTPALTLTSVNVVVSTPTVTPTPVSAADSSPTSDTTEAAEQPPSPEPAESDTLATPKPQSEVEKWLAETDAKQQETFQQQVIKPYEAGLAALRARYLAALDAALLKASSAGQLDQSLVWRTEKQNFTVNQTIPADDATTAPEIRAMRADYRQKFAQLELERAARAKQLFTNYDAILLKNSTLLTQRKRLDDALLLHTKRKELAKAWGIESQQQPVTAQPATAQPAGVKPSTPAPSGKNQTSVSLLTLTPAKEPIIGYGELIQGKNDFYGDPVNGGRKVRRVALSGAAVEKCGTSKFNHGGCSQICSNGPIYAVEF